MKQPPKFVIFAVKSELDRDVSGTLESECPLSSEISQLMERERAHSRAKSHEQFLLS